MKINNNNFINFKARTPIVKGVQELAGRTFSRVEELGEGTNITLDFLGKAILVPAVIMAASKEDKETKQYSAIKNPIAATIQLALEVPVLALGSKAIAKLANSGKLDAHGSNISYNEQAYKDVFVENLKKCGKTNPEFNNKSAQILEKLKEKGLNKNIKGEFGELIENHKISGKTALKNSLENFDLAHKRLYHLQNRFCFLSAIILTPIMCKAEDFLFPKAMSFFKKPKTERKPREMSLNQFKNLAKRGANDKTN